MDTIDEFLATSALSSKYSAAIQAALSVGKKTLNRYYAKTDLSSTYRIAMGTSHAFFYFIITRYVCLQVCSLVLVLHPRHKLSYFKKAKWEDDWIKAAGQLVRDEFDLSYRQPSNSQESALGNEVRVVFFSFDWSNVFYTRNRPRSVHQKAITSLTTWPRSPHPSRQTFVMSWNATLALTPSMLLTLFVGGMTVAQIIRISQGWQWIISSSLVSDCIRIIIVLTSHVMFTSYFCRR